MHILLLPSWYDTVDKPWRGTFFKDQALSLMKHGLRVGIAFVERRSLSRLRPMDLLRHRFQITAGEEHGVPTVRMKGWSTFAQTTAGALVWTSLTRRLVASYISSYGVPDVIHGHAALWGGYAAMLVARDHSRPYLVTEHASSILILNVSRGDSRRVRDTYRNASRVIAVSEALKASVDCVAGRPVADVVPNTVDPSFFRLPPEPRRTRPFVFLSVGDLVPSKRTGLLIRAFARLHKQNPQTRLVIVGAGRQAPKLSDLTNALELDGVVTFTGSLTRPGVRQQMWDANALVVSSDYETFGVVLLEALSTGIPVIATRCGGPDDIITPDIGALIACNDEEALARAMSDFVARSFDPLHLRASVTRRFGYDEIARRLCEIYDAAATNRREVA
jgi:glycosyltransferase involved in cell wall biosynthesis